MCVCSVWNAVVQETTSSKQHQQQPGQHPTPAAVSVLNSTHPALGFHSQTLLLPLLFAPFPPFCCFLLQLPHPAVHLWRFLQPPSLLLCPLPGRASPAIPALPAAAAADNLPHGSSSSSTQAAAEPGRAAAQQRRSSSSSRSRPRNHLCAQHAAVDQQQQQQLERCPGPCAVPAFPAQQHAATAAAAAWIHQRL